MKKIEEVPIVETMKLHQKQKLADENIERLMET